MNTISFKNFDIYTKLNNCFEVQKTLSNCIYQSETYSKLKKEVQKTVSISTSNQFIANYLSYQNGNYLPFGPEDYSLFNTQGTLWRENNENLTALHEECNLLSLHECMNGVFNN